VLARALAQARVPGVTAVRTLTCATAATSPPSTRCAQPERPPSHATRHRYIHALQGFSPIDPAPCVDNQLISSAHPSPWWAGSGAKQSTRAAVAYYPYVGWFCHADQHPNNRYNRVTPWSTPNSLSLSEPIALPIGRGSVYNVPTTGRRRIERRGPVLH
jgi:hypothetical protein